MTSRYPPQGHKKQPEHLSRRSYQVAWTIVIHCSTACLTASSAKFSPSRTPPLGFSLELDEGTTSRQFCVSCTGFLCRDLACFVYSSLSGQAPTYLADDVRSRAVRDVGFARSPTDRALFHAHTTHLATEALLLPPGHVFGTASSQRTCATKTNTYNSFGHEITYPY